MSDSVSRFKRPDKIVSDSAQFPAPMALRMADLSRLTGLSRRAIERERAARRFPEPDRVVGRVPLWHASTIDQWLRGN
jgi:predicted DNA-binding transcriptional regulator AlpA